MFKKSSRKSCFNSQRCCGRPGCGMPDGEYELGGQIIILKNGEARLQDGTLAGAVSDLYEDMINAMRFGIPTEDAILAAKKMPVLLWIHGGGYFLGMKEMISKT